MPFELHQYVADHLAVLDTVRRCAGMRDPIAIDLGDFQAPLMKIARRGPILPIEGVLVRDWDPESRRTEPGTSFGMRLYFIAEVRFARIRCLSNYQTLEYAVVDRPDYARLYRAALACRREQEPPAAPPVLPAYQLKLLWANTIGFLESDNINRIRAYGGRPRRGVLLTGAPGNGKTMACRWIWQACRQRGWDFRSVTPDNYRQARSNDSVAELFQVQRRGVVFFDDMDIALRDRDTVQETEDQAVFLSALDGLTTVEGVVYIFTTNCSLDLIDRAFKRPGRLDVTLHFARPDETLRAQMIARWHADIRAHLRDRDIVAVTDGFSFAELDELKNLLVMHHFETGEWDWPHALAQFHDNRGDLHGQRKRQIGLLNCLA